MRARLRALNMMFFPFLTEGPQVRLADATEVLDVAAETSSCFRMKQASDGSDLRSPPLKRQPDRVAGCAERADPEPTWRRCANAFCVRYLACTARVPASPLSMPGCYAFRWRRARSALLARAIEVVVLECRCRGRDPIDARQALRADFVDALRRYSVEDATNDKGGCRVRDPQVGRHWRCCMANLIARGPSRLPRVGAFAFRLGDSFCSVVRALVGDTRCINLCAGAGLAAQRCVRTRSLGP